MLFIVIFLSSLKPYRTNPKWGIKISGLFHIPLWGGGIAGPALRRGSYVPRGGGYNVSVFYENVIKNVLLLSFSDFLFL